MAPMSILLKLIERNPSIHMQEAEIIDYGTVGYDTNNRNGGRLKQFLVKHMDVDSDLAEHVTRLVQIQITGGCDMQDVFYVFEEMGLEPPDKRYLDDLIQHINNLWNHTRMILNRGFTPEELSSAVSNHALTLSKRNKVIDFETVRKQKIYPNDPCP